MKGYEKVAEMLFASREFDSFGQSEILAVLQGADDQYYNGAGTSFLTDEEYDALRKYAERAYPHHVYFTGVGSDVRGGKIKLPYQMGSLDQVEIGEIADWVGNWSLQKQIVVITDKLDGTSAMVIYDESGDLQIAYSRGNGIEGADITRHIKHLVPANIGRQAVIRGEVIIPKSAFEDARRVVKSRSGEVYKNARNMVAGLMNAKTNPIAVYNHIHFVAYDILGSDAIDKVNMLDDLEKWGFRTPYFSSGEGRTLTDDVLASYINDRRGKTDYEIDGIVIDVNLAAKREQMNPTRDTLNPAYAIKYKVADASNVAIARVINVEYNVSKHGYLKPKVQVEPVNLVGVTVSNATGFNAKFIHDNEIGPGAEVQITRSGDVIPFIQKVIKPADHWQEPEQDWEWNETDVDAVLANHHGHEDVIINRMVDFFASIEAPFLKKGNVAALYGYKGYEEADIIRLSEHQLVMVLGENGKKVYAGLRKALTDIPMWKLMGSTTFFGRGVGKRKMKKLIDALGAECALHASVSDITKVEGFDAKTAQKIVLGMGEYLDWVIPLEDEGFITIQYETGQVAGGKLTGEKVVFTGFRNKELQEQAEANGATMQSSVSSKTTILVASNPNSNSGKMKKARDLGVRVMSIEEFEDLLK